MPAETESIISECNMVSIIQYFVKNQYFHFNFLQEGPSTATLVNSQNVSELGANNKIETASSKLEKVLI